MSLPMQITGPYGKPLLLLEPHSPDSQPNALAVHGDEIATPHGARIVDTSEAPSTARLDYEFRVTREELAFLEAFFDARLGMANGFWMPLWHTWEFEVRGFEFPNAGQPNLLWVNRTGYVESIYPLGTAERQLLLLWEDRYQSFTATSVTASDAPGVDLLHLTGNGGESGTPIPTNFFHVSPQNDAYRPLLLAWVRFDQDELLADHRGGDGAAIVTLAVRGLPAEAPSS